MRHCTIILLIMGTLLVAPLGRADDRVDRLDDDSRAWLEEEVVYIITPEEKDVFLSLETKEERDRFIEAFWHRRDPNPATLENEAMVEHYRRLEHAVRVLGRDATVPGWKTDRGKYYIILGEPADIQRYDGYNELVETELWIYNGDTSAGLPARFNLLFFKENNVGAFQLYHPFSDGPEALLNAGYGFRTNQNLAVDLLETISVDVARASLTIDLSEPTAQMFSARNTRDPQLLQVRPSMAVDRNLADIEEYQIKKVNTDYLQGYLDYGNRVSADYSFNYIVSRSVFAVLAGPKQTPFLHYSLEIDPGNLSLEMNEDKTSFYTTLDVTLELRNKEGQLLAMTQNSPFIQLSATDFERASAFPFAYRDSFPLLPGDYLVSVILRNRLTKEYSVAETEVSVPELARDQAFLSSLLLASNTESHMAATEDEHKTFQLGSFELDPVADGVFAIGSNIHAVSQVVGGSGGERVRFSLLSGEGAVMHTEDVRVSDVSGVVAADLPLLQLEAGTYQVRAELLDAAGAVVAGGVYERKVTLSPRTTIPRPAFVYRHSFNSEVPGLLEMTLGEQLMVQGRLDEAEAKLREAVAAENPNLDMAKWKLASAVLFKRDADEALRLLLPLEAGYPDQIEVVEGLGFSFYIKEDYGKALTYLEHARALRPPDTSLLNAIGDCYEQMSDSAKAREAFEQSLALNPGQEGVKARLAGLSG